MRNGQCPKCGSWDVYIGTNIPVKRGTYYSNSIPIKGHWAQSHAILDNYVCVSCGYVESYILDPGKLKEIAENWDRVAPYPGLTPPDSSPR
jgi:predicted RNA-binding Zn-ribbon protein involved in translation (DUF1610 family)